MFNKNQHDDYSYGNLSYAEKTHRDRNVFKRWFQGRRIADALKLVEQINEGHESLNVLDYGAGDGEVAGQVARLGCSVDAFEPGPTLYHEIKSRLKDTEVNLLVDSKAIPVATYDLVLCLEVLEHLPLEQEKFLFQKVLASLKPGGFLLVGVPYEIYLPALLKGIFRFLRRPRAFDSSPRNVFKASLGLRIANRPISELGPDLPYYFQHLGFNHVLLEERLREDFKVLHKWYSPFRTLGPIVNSEVYYLASSRSAE